MDSSENEIKKGHSFHDEMRPGIFFPVETIGYCCLTFVNFKIQCESGAFSDVTRDIEPAVVSLQNSVDN